MSKIKFKCTECNEEDLLTQEEYDDCEHFADGLCCICSVDEQDRLYLEEL